MVALLAPLALGACVQVQASAPAPTGPLRVTNNGGPFANDQGALARRVAQDTCVAQGRGLVSGPYDRFEAGAWVYPGGCA